MQHISAYTEIVMNEVLMQKYPRIMDTVILCKQKDAGEMTFKDLRIKIYSKILDRDRVSYIFRTMPAYPADIEAMKGTLKNAETEHEKGFIKSKMDKVRTEFYDLYHEAAQQNLSNYYELTEMKEMFEKAGLYKYIHIVADLLSGYDVFIADFRHKAAKKE